MPAWLAIKFVKFAVFSKVVELLFRNLYTVVFVCQSGSRNFVHVQK